MKIYNFKILLYFLFNKNILCFNSTPNNQFINNNNKNEIKNIIYKNNIKQDIIYITPGGYKGYYMLGIANYIKENYDISNKIFIGASVGSWISLLMCYKYNNNDLLKKINIINNNIININTKILINNYLKKELLINYNTSDFNLDKLMIGITHIDNNKLTPYLYYNFINLEDAINACIASSYIPFLTGKYYYIYNNKYSLDGGFIDFPYFKDDILYNSKLIIHPYLWLNNNTNNIDDNNNIINNLKKWIKNTTLLNKYKYNIIELYQNGYNNSLINKKYLDLIFL